MSIYGIDFGYSKACIATIDRNGKPMVIRNLADASDELAAAVFFENADNVIVGSCARDMMETDGDRVVQFIKKDLGKHNGRVYEFDGKSFNPVEISALILKRLKQMAEEQGESVNDVVVAIPSYFGLEEKVALKNAVELAGLNLIEVITIFSCMILEAFHLIFLSCKYQQKLRTIAVPHHFGFFLAMAAIH